MKLVGLGITVVAEGQALRRRSTIDLPVFPLRTANRAFLPVLWRTPLKDRPYVRAERVRKRP